MVHVHAPAVSGQGPLLALPREQEDVQRAYGLAHVRETRVALVVTDVFRQVAQCLFVPVESTPPVLQAELFDPLRQVERFHHVDKVLVGKTFHDLHLHMRFGCSEVSQYFVSVAAVGDAVFPLIDDERDAPVFVQLVIADEDRDAAGVLVDEEMGLVDDGMEHSGVVLVHLARE